MQGNYVKLARLQPATCGNAESGSDFWLCHAGTSHRLSRHVRSPGVRRLKEEHPSHRPGYRRLPRFPRSASDCLGSSTCHKETCAGRPASESMCRPSAYPDVPKCEAGVNLATNRTGRPTRWALRIFLRRPNAVPDYRLFELNRDGVSGRLPDVFSWRLRCVMGAVCRVCRRCGRACAGLPGYGSRMPGGLRVWRAC